MRASFDPNHAVLRLARGDIGDEPGEAWRLIETAWPALTRFVQQRLVAKKIPREWVLDCGQNVFRRVWKYRKGYRGTTESEWWAWLRMITDNELRRLMASEGRQPIPATDFEGRSGSGGDGSSDGEGSTSAFSGTSALEDPRFADAHRRGRSTSAGADDGGAGGSGSGGTGHGLGGDPTLDAVLDRESREKVRDCIERLPATHRKVVELIFLRKELSERAVAAAFGCSPSYVHKVKSQALERLRRCMKSKGMR